MDDFLWSLVEIEMDWLEKIQPPKFYRYMFYKVHQWATKFIYRFSIDPDVEPLWILPATVCVQFFFLIELTRLFTPVISDTLFGNGPYPFLGTHIGLFFLSILYFGYKKKWKRFITEFEGESQKENKRGNTYLVIYLFTNFFVLPALGLWLITVNNPNYQ